VAVNWGSPKGTPGQQAVGLGDVVRFVKDAAAKHFPRLVVGLTKAKDVVKAAVQKTKAATVTWLTDYTEAFKQRKAKPVFILFTSPKACIHCQRLEAGALADDTVKTALADCVCLKVDVTTEDGAALAAKFNATAWPTIFVYRGDKIAAHHAGNLTADELLKLIR
jgi:thiol:disulfide interchange protein